MKRMRPEYERAATVLASTANLSVGSFLETLVRSAAYPGEHGLAMIVKTRNTWALVGAVALPQITPLRATSGDLRHRAEGIRLTAAALLRSLGGRQARAVAHRTAAHPPSRLAPDSVA